MYFLDKSSQSNFNFLDFPLLVPEVVQILHAIFETRRQFLYKLCTIFNILAKNISVKCKWNFFETPIQSLQRSLNLLFPSPIVCIGVSTPPKKIPPPLFLAKPSFLQTVQVLHFQAVSHLNIVFFCEPPLKVGFFSEPPKY